MPIDSNIALSYRPPEIESPLNALAKVMQVKGLQSQQDLTAYTLKKAQREDEDTNSLRASLAEPGADVGNALLRLGKVKEYSDYQKSQNEALKVKSEIGKNDVETEHKAIGIYRDASQAIADPQGAVAFVTTMHADPRLKNSAIAQVPLDQLLAQIPQDPAQLAAWKQQFALGATKFMELNKPTTHFANTGGATQVVQTPGLGGAPQVVGSMKNSVSPDAQLQASTSRANNQATIAKDLQVAGMTPGGGMDDNAERTAQAIANGQLPAPTGMALLNPKNQRILGRVMEINPQYDATTVSAKKAAATAFTSGQLGNALRSVSTANAHLDQLGELADALDNGNTQVVNKVQNYFSKATGNPAVTNFDAIKAIVGQEVVKAIVAGGGGVGEREEAAKIFSSASSPAQLKGAIQHYRMVMGAQANNLMEQRRAAGLPDTTLPDYTKTNTTAAAPTVPSDIAAILQKHGGK